MPDPIDKKKLLDSTFQIDLPEERARRAEDDLRSAVRVIAALVKRAGGNVLIPTCELLPADEISTERTPNGLRILVADELTELPRQVDKQSDRAHPNFCWIPAPRFAKDIHVDQRVAALVDLTVDVDGAGEGADRGEPSWLVIFGTIVRHAYPPRGAAHMSIWVLWDGHSDPTDSELWTSWKWVSTYGPATSKDADALRKTANLQEMTCPNGS